MLFSLNRQVWDLFLALISVGNFDAFSITLKRGSFLMNLRIQILGLLAYFVLKYTLFL